MPRRHTRLLPADDVGIETAASILRDGGLVAFPTETVYGLGAHALDAEAVRGIFRAKGRPADDPVIVHLAEASQLETIVREVPATALQLAECFWPGPLTLVLPKRSVVPAEVTAGLDTVGVRVPSHPTARALLYAAGLPVAAPSANLFGRPSPTTAQHVVEDLDGRIDAVLDGGAANVGLESTIVDLTAAVPRLLRPGGLAAEAIETVLGTALAFGAAAQLEGPQRAPGMLLVHYAPRTPLTLVRGFSEAAQDRLMREVEAALRAGLRVGVLTLAEDVALLPSAARLEAVGSAREPTTLAANLFTALRALDGERLDVLFARDLADPSVGLGRALADRLRRAAQVVVDSDSTD